MEIRVVGISIYNAIQRWLDDVLSKRNDAYLMMVCIQLTAIHLARFRLISKFLESMVLARTHPNYCGMEIYPGGAQVATSSTVHTLAKMARAKSEDVLFRALIF